MDTPTEKHIELAGTVTVGPKGQVVIPADVRVKMHIAPGDKLVVLYIPDKQSVGFVPESQVQNLIDRMGARVNEFRSALKK